MKHILNNFNCEEFSIEEARSIKKLGQTPYHDLKSKINEKFQTNGARVTIMLRVLTIILVSYSTLADLGYAIVVYK
jgi:hypothetical protein